MRWTVWTAATAVLLATSPARAASVYAEAGPIMFRCAPFGDPACHGGQVSNDPALDAVFDNRSGVGATGGALAEKNYLDPRIGTANAAGGRAQAVPGMLRASSYGSASSSPVLTTGSGSPSLTRMGAFASASFTDEITIVPANPALIGTTGTLSASFEVDGLLHTSAVNTQPNPNQAAYASWALSITVNGPAGQRSFTSQAYELVSADSQLTTWQAGPQGIVTFSAPVQLGVPFTLTGYLSTSAQAHMSAANAQPLVNGLSATAAESSYDHTAVWNGVSSVTSSGQPVSFTVTSGSGVDYARRLDADFDGISDDADACPYFSDPLQADRDGNGRGDACECGDQSGDGRVDVRDLVAINGAIFDPARITPLCDANNDGLCNVADIVAANAEIFSRRPTSTCARQPVPSP
jgi:hypothetical protein